MPTAEAAPSQFSAFPPDIDATGLERVVAPQAPEPEACTRAALRRRARLLRRAAWAAGGAGAALAVAEAAWTAGFWPEVGTGVVAGSWPMGSELDGRPLLERLDAGGWTCALPVVVGTAAPLLFRRWRPGQALAAGAHGIPEPLASAPLVVPEVVLVPMLSFDRAGHRLGQGGGHYDRTLAALRARGAVLAVGLAFAAQEERGLPVASHDQRLDWIVTENGAFRVPSP